jgi:hypothetical protein
MTDLEMKSFGPFEVKDEARGEVVAIVATLGVVDKDGDVIMPGSFPAGGSRVKLSGYSHDVITEGAAPVGKGVVTEENGHAVFRGNFFMTTQRGREAFHTTKELGPEGEWSFGFPKAVKTGELSEEWRTKGARRVITGLTPIEASPVFIGAGWGTGTVLTKSAEPSPEPVAQADGDPAVDAAVPSVQTETAASDEPAPPAPPAETEEAKAAREADAALKAKVDEAMEEFHRVQRTLRRMGYAA